MNGISGPIPIDEAIEICQMLVALERAIPAERWVTEMVAEQVNAELTGSFGAC